jgi:hypothetical protein
MSILNDYEVLFDEHKEEKLARIKLTSDKWGGIIYNYHTVRFLEEDDENATLKFEYDVISTPEELDVDSLTKDDHQEFENHLGDILVSIIEEATSDESGTNNTKQSNL